MASNISIDGVNDGIEVVYNHETVNQYISAPERAQTPPEPLSTVPFPRNPDFIDHGTLLKDLREKCLAPDARVALVGLGGVGKSQLAIEYCFQTRDISPETWVFWVHASNIARFEQGYRRIAEQGRVLGCEGSSATLMRSVFNWLQDPKKKWILILDNLDDGDFLYEPRYADNGEGGAKLPPVEFLPHSPNGSIIMTTRTKRVARDLVDEANLIPINPMTEADAVALLEAKLGNEVKGHDKEDVLRLAKTLEYMPLTIVQAARFIYRQSPLLSVRQYLEEFEKSDRERFWLLTDEARHPDRDWKASNSILVTWRLSFEQIRAKRPSAADLLSLMSFFDNHAIPETLLHFQDFDSDWDLVASEEIPTTVLADANNKNKDQEQSKPHSTDSWFDRFNMLRLSAWPAITRSQSNELSRSNEEGESSSKGDQEAVRTLKEHSLRDDISILRDYSFISIGQDPSHFEMHRLVQVATRMWLEAQGALEKWLKDFIYRLENAISVHPGRESRTVCLPLFPHLESARLQRPSSQELIIRWGKLLFQTADHAFALGNMAVVLAMHIASTQAFEDCLGPQHGATIEAMILTGQAYAHLAQYIEAEKFFHKAILHGTDEWTVLCAKAELVEVYQSQGRLVDAELQALDVIEKTTRLSGPEHAICLMSMERLAGVYQIQGRLKEADVLALEALALQTRSRLEAPDHADKALEYTSMACLGSIYQQAGNFLMAEQLCREAAYGLKEILGSDNPLTIEILYCLGEIWFKQGRMDDYELLINFLLPICTRVLSLKHPTTLHINIDKAFMYSCRGQLHETEELVENILLARQGVSGFDGSSTLLELKAILSQSYMRDDRFLEAEELATQCLREKKEIPGSDHPDTLIGTELLASMWNMQGRKADATNLLIYCLKSRLRVLPEDRDAIEKVRNLLRAWALDSGHESIDELLSPNGGQENPEDIFEDGLSLLFNFAM